MSYKRHEGVVVFRSPSEYSVFKCKLGEAMGYSLVLIGTLKRTHNKTTLSVHDINDKFISAVDSLEDGMKTLECEDFVLCKYSYDDFTDWVCEKEDDFFLDDKFDSIQYVFDVMENEFQNPTGKVVTLSVEKVDGQEQLLIQRHVPIMVLCPYNDKAEPNIRYRGYGFGSFLLGLEIHQIEYDKKVLNFLKSSVNRKYSSIGDLFGFSFTEAPQAVDHSFHKPYICYASGGYKLYIPAEDCTIELNVYKKLKEHLETA